jgi:hypothetical protein
MKIHIVLECNDSIAEITALLHTIELNIMKQMEKKGKVYEIKEGSISGNTNFGNFKLKIENQKETN